MSEEMKAKVVKILKGAAIAALAAGLTTGAQLLTQTDFGSKTPLVMFLASVLVNAAKVMAKL